MITQLIISTHINVSATIGGFPRELNKIIQTLKKAANGN